MNIDLDARAVFNDDGTHRYYLSRQLEGGGPAMAFVMLNPSTADEETNDRTIDACCRIANRNDTSAIRVVNLYSRISSNPLNLYHMTAEQRTTPEALIVRDFVLAATERVVFAWGGSYKPLLPSLELVQALGRGCMNPPTCVGRCANGAPKHPLYQQANVELHEYRAGEE